MGNDTPSLRHWHASKTNYDVVERCHNFQIMISKELKNITPCNCYTISSMVTHSRSRYHSFLLWPHFETSLLFHRTIWRFWNRRTARNINSEARNINSECCKVHPEDKRGKKADTGSHEWYCAWCTNYDRVYTWDNWAASPGQDRGCWYHSDRWATTRSEEHLLWAILKSFSRSWNGVQTGGVFQGELQLRGK